MTLRVCRQPGCGLLTDRGLRPANAPTASSERGLLSRLPFVGRSGQSEGLPADKDNTLRPPVTP